MPLTTKLPNRVTIVGRGVPANYELGIDGSIEIEADGSYDGTVIVSGQTAEGTIETGVHRFRFSGEMANVHLIDWNGTPAPASPSTPFVHIDYGIAGREKTPSFR